MTPVTKPSLLNLNIVDTTNKIGGIAKAVATNTYQSIRTATKKDVLDFTLKAATNIGAGALTKAFVGATLAGSAPVAVTIGVTAVSVAAVSTKITHWRDCKKAIANNEEPPKFNWKNYGLKGLFSTAMFGVGVAFSDQILGLLGLDTSNTQDALSELTTSQIIASDLAEIRPNETGIQEVPIETIEPVTAPPTILENQVSEPTIIEAPIAPIAPAQIVETDILNVEAIAPTVIEDVTAQRIAPIALDVDIITPIEDIPIVTTELPEPPIAIPALEIAQPILQPITPDAANIALPEIEITPYSSPSMHAPAPLQSFDANIAISAPEINTLISVPTQEIAIAHIDMAPEIITAITPLPTPDIAPENFHVLAPFPQPIEPISIETPVLHAVDTTDISIEAIEPPPEMSVITELQFMDISPRAENALEAHINGNSQGTVDLGYFYFHGEQGLPQDYERAVELYREAAEADNLFAIRDLAYVENQAAEALGAPVPANDITEIVQPTTAPALDTIEQLQTIDIGPRAETALEAHLDGNAQGTADLGYFYFHGEQGLPQDYERAVELYREAASEGNRFALRDLSYIEAEAEKALGYPVPETSTIETPATDVEVLTLEIESITDDAVVQLQELDLGSRANIALGAHLDGHAQGTADLGYFYFHGEQGLPQDLEKAVEFYREAALNGNGFAIRDLAFVEQEAVKAGLTLNEFELPAHLYEQSAPAIQTEKPTSNDGGTVRSGLRASCVGNLQAVNGSTPQLQFDCNVRGNNSFIYPGEHVKVNLPNGVSQIFNLDASATRQPVNDFLQNSVLPVATNSYTPG